MKKRHEILLKLPEYRKYTTKFEIVADFPQTPSDEVVDAIIEMFPEENVEISQLNFVLFFEIDALETMVDNVYDHMTWFNQWMFRVYLQEIWKDKIQKVVEEHSEVVQAHGVACYASRGPLDWLMSFLVRRNWDKVKNENGELI